MKLLVDGRMTTVDAATETDAESTVLADLKRRLRFDEDVNRWSGESRGWTALHDATCNGHLEIMRFLMSSPGINVNAQTEAGSTPLFLACSSGHLASLKLLLSDPRVDVNLADVDGWTPVWVTCQEDQGDVLKWLIASGRDFDWRKPGRFGAEAVSPMWMTEKFGRTSNTLLMSKILDNPVRTRREVRLELGLIDPLIAELFALIIFLCDDHLALSPGVCVGRRFFLMSLRLPIELQMLLCHRAFDSAGQHVLSNHGETSFSNLALSLSQNEQ